MHVTGEDQLDTSRLGLLPRRFQRFWSRGGGCGFARGAETPKGMMIGKPIDVDSLTATLKAVLAGG